MLSRYWWHSILLDSQTRLRTPSHLSHATQILAPVHFTPGSCTHGTFSEETIAAVSIFLFVSIFKLSWPIIPFSRPHDVPTSAKTLRPHRWSRSPARSSGRATWGVRGCDKFFSVVGSPKCLDNYAHNDWKWSRSSYIRIVSNIISSRNNLQARKRRKLSKYIPESKYAVGKYDSEIIDLADIQYEYALLSARLDLVSKNPSSLPTGGQLSL